MRAALWYGGLAWGSVALLPFTQLGLPPGPGNPPPPPSHQAPDHKKNTFHTFVYFQIVPPNFCAASILHFQVKFLNKGIMVMLKHLHNKYCHYSHYIDCYITVLILLFLLLCWKLALVLFTCVTASDSLFG